MIIFPATGVFADLGPMGVSMFFLTTVVAQLVYTVGGSGFAGANGSMMIEVVVSSLSVASFTCSEADRPFLWVSWIAFLPYYGDEHCESDRRR